MTGNNPADTSMRATESFAVDFISMREEGEEGGEERQGGEGGRRGREEREERWDGQGSNHYV